jgi:phospholipase C
MQSSHGAHWKFRTALLTGILLAVAGHEVAQSQTAQYQHVFIILEENHSFQDIIDNPASPRLTQLAQRYGVATKYYAITHPSQPNYIALLSGSTFGITDDDAFYCTSGTSEQYCPNAKKPGYPSHTITARSLMDQLRQHGLTWRGYFESIPSPGSKLVFSAETADEPPQLYSAKHNGFMNFASVQKDPDIANEIVGFDRLKLDLKSGRLPNYAYIVPNQCNDMHALDGPKVPKDCEYRNYGGVVTRGDKTAGELVDLIMSSPVWSSAGKSAIVITWDEDSGPHHDSDPKSQGCCGFDPSDKSNAGGGRIPTIVITNHGPRGVADDTPYNHYSLLRTVEDVFGISEHLRSAGNDAQGARTMKKLFGLP